MWKILLTGPLNPDAEGRLAAGAEVVRPTGEGETALCAAVADCDAIVARTATKITRAVLAAGGRLRVVGVAGVGVDNVDIEAAKELGIAVVNTPAAAADAVAELAVALMLELLRPTGRLGAAYAAGQYRAAREQPHGVELATLTVGIVGMGRIGSRVGRICAAGFGARVLYNDIVDVGPFAYPAVAVDKDTLWAASDIVSLHVPLTPATRGLVGADVLGQMKPGARLINTSRGAVVETEALADAVGNGRLAGAALDVTEPEPLPAGHRLFACERCLLTPHVAARTHGGWARMHAVVDDVLEFLDASGE
ncbi:MAG: NAD(P)-dependent oxidoreductase [Phycisphaerae bacterium]